MHPANRHWHHGEHEAHRGNGLIYVRWTQNHTKHFLRLLQRMNFSSLPFLPFDTVGRSMCASLSPRSVQP